MLKEKQANFKNSKSLFKAKMDLNQAAPNRQWLGARHQQGRDFDREKVEARKFLDGL